MNTKIEDNLSIESQSDNLHHHLIVIYANWNRELGFHNHTYNIPVSRIVFSTQDVNKLADAYFNMVPGAYDKCIKIIDDREFDIYCKIGDLKTLLYYLPCLHYLKRGRDLILEQYIEDECGKSMKELELDPNFDTILNIESQYWK